MNLARRQTQLPQKMSSFFQFLHQKPWESTWIHELKSNHAVKRVRSRTFISSLNLMHTGLGLSTYLELFCRSFAFDISRWLAIWFYFRCGIYLLFSVRSVWSSHQQSGALVFLWCLRYTGQFGITCLPLYSTHVQIAVSFISSSQVRSDAYRKLSRNLCSMLFFHF